MRTKPPNEVARHVEPIAAADLAQKMVFFSGPRQCGKTTLAHRIQAAMDPTGTQSTYYNWDVAAHRKALRQQALPADARLIILDELHKLRTWKAWLKGLYDLEGQARRFIVTGSARLDVYRRGGDSLQGRFFHHRVHPLTLSELLGRPPHETPEAMLALEGAAAPNDLLAQLFARGGFPEPLLAASASHAARWRRSYGERLVREDLRDLSEIRDLDKVELLFDRLPETIGALLSVNALREDLEVNHRTVQGWLSALEHLYAVFIVAPYGPPRLKAVKKQPKLYFWDAGRVSADAARAENLVMSHLLRLCHWLHDVMGERAELRFYRDDQGHEVDAVVMRDGKPWLAVEVKSSDEGLDRGLRYLLERVSIPFAFQVSLQGQQDRLVRGVGTGHVRLTPAARFLAHLP